MIRRQALTGGLAALTLAAGGAVAFAPSASAAQHLPVAYGLTDADRLITFLTEQPGAAPLSNVAIGGLAVGDDVVGLDVRPATGELYALVNGAAADRLVVVNPADGAVVRSVPLSVQLSGASFGVDVNPAVDRVRIVSDADQNLRAHPDTGATIVDGPLAYRTTPAPADANAGANPTVTAAAYENNVPGGNPALTPATELYGIDTGLDIMVEQDPPNAGTLSTVGPLGVNAEAVAGFDIAGSDGGTPRGYAVLTVAGEEALYTVNTDTGAAARVGAFPVGTTVEDLAVADPRFVAQATAATTEGAPVTVTVTRVGDTRFAGSVTVSTAPGTAGSGADVTAATGTLSFGPGETSKSFTVQTLEDNAEEGPETFTAVLSAPTGQNSTLGRQASVVTIRDNEEGRTFGLTSGNELVTFSLSSPGTVSARIAVTGLQTGEDLVGLDVRPATGELYAVGSTSRVYKLNPTTAAATAVGVPFTPALSGTSYGLDFNPVVDRLRVVSSTGQNLRLHPDTGAAAGVDTTLAYAGTDAGNGTPPRVAAAAYTNNSPGVTSTMLFDLETARDVLITQAPPNDGILNTVGALGVTVSDTATVGLDIASFGGAAFAALTVDGTTAPALYRVDLATGRATLIGAFGDVTVEDLSVAAIAPAQPASSATPTASATPSPRPSGSGVPNVACTTPSSVTLERTTIIATGSSGVTVRTTANSIVDLVAYTRPSTTYRVVRSAAVGASGVAEFRITPPANTRLYAQQRGCNVSPSVVLNVRTALSLAVVRNGVRNYTFSGDSLPARPGGLIVSLYRVTSSGSQILTAQTRASATTGDWVIRRAFTGSGRFGFVVRTGQDLQNAPGASNVRSLLVF